MKKLIENINIVKSDLENDISIYLNKNMKNKINETYNKILNKKSNEMNIIIEEKKNLIKTIFENLFILDSDDVLNDINLKLNNTQNAIKEYNNFLNNFRISEDMLFYIENFGKNKIKPCYENLLNLLNEITKNEIVESIEKNSKNYEESYDKNKILKFLNDSINEVKNKYIHTMNNSIYSYGIDNYKDNLNKKINENKLRMLNENETLYNKKVADKSIDEKFHKLLNNSNNMKNLIKNYENSNEFEKIIQKNIDKLEFAYKTSKTLIKKNEYSEEIELLIINKLEFLKNMSFDYYNKINESYYKIKNDFNSSIEEIDKLLNLCANKTFITFIDKYYEISNFTQSINTEREEEIEEYIKKEYPINLDNMIYYTDIHITNLVKKANFKFVFNFDEINNLKMPKIYAHVINLSRPKKVKLDIYSNIGTCGKNVESYKIVFNNVNYSMFLDFNTDSNDIISTIITDFDGYEYFIERYLIEDSPDEKICLKELYDNPFFVDFCFYLNECERYKTISPKTKKYIDKKYNKKMILI